MLTKIKEKFQKLQVLPKKHLYLVIACSVIGLGLLGGGVYKAFSDLPKPAEPPIISAETIVGLLEEEQKPIEQPKPVEQAKPTTAAPKPAPAKPSTPAVPSLEETINDINNTLSAYGISATLDPEQNASTYSTWDKLSGDDAATLRTFAGYLKQEWAKYPKDLVASSGLKKIGLVKGLKVSGTARNAAPAPAIQSMLYDATGMVNAGSSYARQVISHEYWHYLDYAMRSSYGYDDSDWKSCNPSDFSYGSGGASAYGSSFSNAFHPSSGFITNYAKYAIEEDRAEMFAWLIYDPGTTKGLGDGGINCKTNRLTDIVRSLSPGMSF